MNVNCPACHQALDVDDSLAGQTVDCPACSQPLILPAPPAPKKPKVVFTKPKPTPPAAQADPASKPCPFCSEPILATAKKCKHCGEFLDPSAARSAPQGPVVTTELTSKKLKAQVLMSALLFWGGLLCFFTSTEKDAEQVRTISALACVAGLVWWILAKVTIWWEHK